MKKRILFVEDDPTQLALYVLMLESERDRWDILTVQDAEEALRLMEQAPFDVVASDWMLPGMDGAALMNEVKRRYPQSSRIILSVLTDQEKVARCLEDTHQFIAKPFDVKVLKSTLSRICGLDAYLREPALRKLVGQLGTLPSFPPIYTEIMRELASPNSSLDRVVQIIQRDPGMIAKMLQIVNSAAIGLAHRVASPLEAVEYLGLGMVRSLVLSAHIFSCFDRPEFDGAYVEQLWNHALRSGMLTQMILRLENADAVDCEDGYVAGMLHDAGKLILANSLPEQFARVRALAAERNAPLHEVELELLGATHAGAAACLLGLWGLPNSIVEAVAFHHTPAASEARAFGVLTAVHVANALEHERAPAEPKGGRPAQVDLNYLAALGLEPRLEEWRAGALDLLQPGLKNWE